MSHSRNTWIIFFQAFARFVILTKDNFLSLLSFREAKKESTYSGMDELLREGPQSFYKKPTGIKIGRSIFTFLLYFFRYEPRQKDARK